MRDRAWAFRHETSGALLPPLRPWASPCEGATVVQNAIAIVAAVLIALICGSAGRAAEPEAPREHVCTRAVASLDGISISAVGHVAAMPMPRVDAGPNGVLKEGVVLPAHCLVQGSFERHTSVDGRSYSIGFELRTPDRWNGRLLYQGGGGLDGHVIQAFGMDISAGSTAAPALARGFAVISTDSGHEGPDAGFAVDQLAKQNYAYAAIGKVATVGRRMLLRLTGAEPIRTYFEGCSNGGREAMIAAQRFPEQFDGVLAGDPAFDLGPATVLAHYSTSVYRTAAAAVTYGAASSTALTEDEGRILRTAILDACDGLDGVRDGFVFNHVACRFDPDAVKCRPDGRAAGCLPAAKTDMLRRAFAGPIGKDGRPLTAPWTWDGGVGGYDWRIWQMGVDGPDGKPNLIFPNLVDDALARYMHFPAVTVAGLQREQPAAAIKAIAPTAAMTGATSTELSTFAARGGKMILVTGWSDPVFAPEDLVRWYRRLATDTRTSTGKDAAGFARLFLVPGMNHCGFGPALDDFDALTALVRWVEAHQAPDAILASGRKYPGVARPLCAFPKIATYRSGPQSLASSFVCAEPGKGAPSEGGAAPRDRSVS